MQKLLCLLQAAIDAGTITISELASKTGVSRQHIYNVLREKSVPTMDLAEKLAEAIGHSVSVTNQAKRKKVSNVA